MHLITIVGIPPNPAAFLLDRTATEAQLESNQSAMLLFN
jgi:hypothetical protein